MCKKKVVLFLIVLGASFLFGGFVHAYEMSDLQIKVFNSDLHLKNQFSFLPEDFQGEVDFTLADVDGDKEKEIILSLSDQENDSKVVIYEKDGTFVREFFPYVKGFKGPIFIAAADMDNSGKAEIITGAGSGGGPQVRIFSQFGVVRFVNDFWAEDKEKYRNGVRVAAGDINGDGLFEVITSTFDDKMKISFFNRFGQEVLDSFELEDGNFFEPGDIMSFDIGEDGVNELILNYGFGNGPELKVLRNDGSELNSFMVYHPGFGGGVDITGSVDNGEKLIVTGAGFTGGPHVRFINTEGEPVKNLTFFPYPDDFKGGVNVSAADIDNDGEIEFVVSPKIVIEAGQAHWPKHIEINIATQQLFAYQYGRLIKTFYISSGTWRHPTPLGQFKVYKKRRSVNMRWSYGLNHPDNYNLPGVPYVLSFTGAYTIHGTYWHRNFGHRMSHGCVNMYTPHSKWVYEWAPMGTPVIVYNGNRDAILGN